MKILNLRVTTFLVLVVLTACTSASKPTIPPKLTEATIPIEPTQVVIPTELAFSTPLVQVLSQSGLSIMSVQDSTYMAMFASTDRAVWIKTNEGIVEVIFFAHPSEVEQIHITEQPNQSGGRHLYIVQAPSPTLLHDQTIDAAFPIYFTVSNDMFMVTSSEVLDKTLKHIFSGQ